MKFQMHPLHPHIERQGNSRRAQLQVLHFPVLHEHVLTKSFTAMEDC